MCKNATNLFESSYLVNWFWSPIFHFLFFLSFPKIILIIKNFARYSTSYLFLLSGAKRRTLYFYELVWKIECFTKCDWPHVGFPFVTPRNWRIKISVTRCTITIIIITIISCTRIKFIFFKQKIFTVIFYFLLWIYVSYQLPIKILTAV